MGYNRNLVPIAGHCIDQRSADVALGIVGETGMLLWVLALGSLMWEM